jgi:KaiC/GvpD/RAD55 family RecA-like ATPase
MGRVERRSVLLVKGALKTGKSMLAIALILSLLLGRKRRTFPKDRS